MTCWMTSTLKPSAAGVLRGGRKKMVNEVSIFFSSSNHLIYAIRMAHRIKNFRGNLDSLVKDSERFNLRSISENPSREELHHNRPLTIPSDYERYVVGRDEDTKHVINFLLDPNFEENLSILSIVGFGGMGKTTLARLVFKDDERLKDHFQQKIWVCVSTNFVAENIIRNILLECVEESRKDEIARLQMSRLHDKLKVELGEKKFLLVLDDVWNEDRSKWLELENHLPYGAKGSKMLVTTRSLRVANTVGSHKPHNLSGLPEEESLTLLMKMANKKEHQWKNHNLENIARGILKKCGGVPLAIMTIGGLLSSRFSEREWSTLLHEDFSRIKQEEGDIMPALKISYDFLPSHLKQCFAYCCLFPKDYRLDPNELVRLWMAQGFIFKSPGKTLHDVGKEYFMELASRSFFQDFERGLHGNITRCKMHDLMHDLATKVAGGSCTTIINNGSSASQEDIPEEVRHVSMVVDMKSYNLDDLGPNQQIRRSLLFINQHQEINSFSGDVSSFRNLRALRLHRLAKGDVLRSIGKLKHLRSLDLSDSDKLTSLPISIGKLLNLETLILYGCKKLESLPREVTKLVNLRYLDMRGCDSLTCTPSGMGNLTNLEIIRLSSCIPPLDQLPSLRSIELCYCKNIRSIPPLDQLSSLESINLYNMEELEWIEVTENKSICLYPSLEGVYFEGLHMLKGWKRKRMDVNRSGDQTIHSSSPFFIPSFSKKVQVGICKCGMLCCTWNDYTGVWLHVGGMKYKDLEEELCRRNRSNVEETSSISTTLMGTLTFVPLSSVPLHTVTDLHLMNLEDTEELPSELFQSLLHLQNFYIIECHRLKSLSGWAIPRYLRSLEFLWIKNCEELDLSSMDQEEDNKAIQGIPNSQTKMRVLILYGMNKMKTLPPWIQYLPKLEILVLDECENMETLPGWFSQLTSLKTLKVDKCGELSRKCQRDTGECWPHISHIEYVDIQ